MLWTAADIGDTSKYQMPKRICNKTQSTRLLKSSIAADATAKPKKRVILFPMDRAPSEDEERRPIFNMT
ncbi:hypothetical protein P5673_024575 [Acropora cervicornis]|uniref:Uncharacterized protein n=1 Tax=Acropora cervicornis TaxID=6130 RepID=A0AAD9Q3J8_ACRCE|nr:hypothetical protein P5673_024575 [Acropora cervicornis]